MLERIEIQDHYARIIHLTLTGQCNMDCCYCSPEQDIEAVKDEMSTKEWSDVIDQVTKEYGPASIVVKGGEPMLRKDFFKILEHIKSKGHSITLVTNGILIQTRETAARLEKIVDKMEISLDGISSETTDLLKGRGMFDRIMTAVDHIKQTKIKLGLSFVILEKNQEILWESLERFIAERCGEDIAVRIDNRVDLPVDQRVGQGDFFDFLRTNDKMACHGRLGKRPGSAELEVDDKGFFHPFPRVSPPVQTA